jgi:uncharacterized coiled-coil protein SlyX
MTIHTDRIVLVFPIAEKNRQAAASLQTLEITESGKEFETLVPIDPALVADYVSEYNLPLIETNQSLTTNLATKTSELATATETIATQAASITSLQAINTEQAATIADHVESIQALEQTVSNLNGQLAARTTERDTLQTQLTEAQSTIASQEARIATLLQEVPFNPRILDITAFLHRLTIEEMLAISAVGPIAEVLRAYKDNDWPVVLDSPEFQGFIAQAVAVGLATEARSAELTRDATRDEAYSPEETE